MPRLEKPKPESAAAEVFPVADIAQAILIVRGHKVLLDSDLAALYGAPTKRLNEQVKRNGDRFPGDFAFRLTRDETAQLNRSQFATGSQRHRDPRFPPLAFTEHGALMAAMVLNSPLAVEMSAYAVRAFIRLRDAISANAALASKLTELESRVDRHDSELGALIATIRELMAPPDPKRRGIGFLADVD